MDVMLPLGLVIAGALALAALLALGRSRYRRAARLPETLTALVIAVSVAVGSWVSFGVRAWPVDVTYRIPHVALLAGATGLLVFGLRGRLLAWAASVGMAGVVSWMLLGPRAAQPDSGGLTLVIAGATLMVVVTASASGRGRTASMGGWFSAVLNAVVVAAACALSGTVTVGVLGGMVTAALVGTSLARVAILPGISLGPALLVASIVQVALLGLAYGYGEMRPAVLVLCSLQIILMGLLGWHRRGDVARVVCVLFLGGMSMWQASRVAAPEATSPEGSSTPAAPDATDYDYGYGY